MRADRPRCNAPSGCRDWNSTRTAAQLRQARTDAGWHCNGDWAECIRSGEATAGKKGSHTLIARSVALALSCFCLVRSFLAPRDNRAFYIRQCRGGSSFLSATPHARDAAKRDRDRDGGPIWSTSNFFPVGPCGRDAAARARQGSRPRVACQYRAWPRDCDAGGMRQPRRPRWVEPLRA